MSAKLLLASAIMAAGSFMFIDTADAQRRGGAERGGNDAAAQSGNRRGGARQNRGANRTANRNGEARGQRGNRANGQAGGQRRAANNNQVRTPRAGNRQATRDAGRGIGRGWWRGNRWAAMRRWAGRPFYRDRGCSAVARRGGGQGRRLRGIYGEGYGRRACRKALNRCNARLDVRQARGRNPFARCVIASR